MTRNEKKQIEIRLERWGEYVDRPAYSLGYPKQSVLAKIQELRVRIQTNRIQFIPNYRFDYQASQVDKILRTAPEEYQRLAMYEWTGVNTKTREEKQAEFAKLVEDYDLTQSKYYKLRDKVLHYVWANITAGAFQSRQ